MCKLDEDLGSSILLLDDEAMILMGLEDAAQDAGLRPLTAADCNEALGLIDANEAIATAVLDFRLGGGLTCMMVARALESRSIPYVVHSADLDLVDESGQLEDVARVNKPSTYKSVIEAALALLPQAPNTLQHPAG